MGKRQAWQNRKGDLGVKYHWSLDVACLIGGALCRRYCGPDVTRAIPNELGLSSDERRSCIEVATEVVISFVAYEARTRQREGAFAVAAVATNVSIVAERSRC